jgi:hypothetical protein
MMMNTTLEQLHTLKLHGMLGALNEQLNASGSASLSFEERLGLLVEPPMAGSNSSTCGQSNSSGQDGVDYESCVVLTANRAAASLSL